MIQVYSSVLRQPHRGLGDACSFLIKEPFTSHLFLPTRPAPPSLHLQASCPDASSQDLIERPLVANTCRTKSPCTLTRSMRERDKPPTLAAPHKYLKKKKPISNSLLDYDLHSKAIYRTMAFL